MNYLLRSSDGYVIRDDGATIPPDSNNSDYANYLAWVAAGNTAGALVEPDMTKLAFQASARTALDASDVTLTRCYENAVLLPQEWKDYRTALRAIISGKSTATVLPTRPAYPAGT